MKRIMSDPQMQRRISNMGLIPIDPPSPAETERYIKSETVKWKTILEKIGLAGSR
jgi:tripartite-type tricarboxylate transporter receptor subunit TctC